ncbi:cbb3-type cytochrome oxidase assembly protein CcoS [Guyparkeria halophila]|uniref:Cbb3-type cytochrome oxidase assembly protein CcoS n=1 Tax=Guyparkeria halophila TaxID=47960 RepID=A0A6I6CVA9_9GAMM|nr:cbb3-type cytochrome oxidase assembly protein CcoS [Guyparkeria halophila]QGT77999.1 cbb3-type cytochrome oxidase assembly protein CcoS [Guyparkeria halophila]
MEVLFLFVPLSMLVVAGLVWAAFWAIRNNQYEDLEGPAHRILMDDDDPKIPTNQLAEETDAPEAETEGRTRHDEAGKSAQPGRE